MKTKLPALALAILVISSLHVLAQQPGNLLWSYNAGDLITTSPAIAPDGTIYIGTYTGLHAITNAGSNKWTFSAYIASSPAIASDGTVYFGTKDGNLHALAPDGSEKWSYPAQGDSGSPSIGSDNTIYVAGYSYLHAISPSGTNKWKANIGDSGRSSPVVGPDDTIYVGGWDSAEFYAFDPMGNQKWVFGTYHGPSDSPALGTNGILYVVAAYDCYVLSPEGTNLRTIDTSYFSSSSSPVIGGDGTIYLENPDNYYLWSLKPNGETNWSLPIGTTVTRISPPTPPAIDSSGMVYYNASNTLFAVTAQGSVAWTFVGNGFASRVAPCIGPDGTIYAAFAGTLYALKGTNTLANTPWPMYRQNPRHTGKIEKPSLQSPKKLADSNFQFQLLGEVGQTYQIERSTDLSLWTTLTNLVATYPPPTITDLTASNFSATFYRALQQ